MKYKCFFAQNQLGISKKDPDPNPNFHNRIHGSIIPNGSGTATLQNIDLNRVHCVLSRQN